MPHQVSAWSDSRGNLFTTEEDAFWSDHRHKVLLVLQKNDKHNLFSLPSISDQLVYTIVLARKELIPILEKMP